MAPNPKLDGRDDAEKLDGRDDAEKLDGRDDQEKLDGRDGIEVVQDIVRRAGNLGGLLVVAFITPISANGASVAKRPLRKSAQADALDRAAEVAAAKKGLAAKPAGVVNS